MSLDSSEEEEKEVGGLGTSELGIHNLTINLIPGSMVAFVVVVVFSVFVHL